MGPRSGELRTQKLKSLLVRTQSLKVLPLKPGVGRCIALHATLTARDFFLANFSKPHPSFSCVRPGSCVGPRNKIGHPAGCRFPRLVLMEYR